MNGKLSQAFDLPGGGRQGDNLYPLIFAIVMHGLTLAVQHCPATGVAIPGTSRKSKIKQYVDDSALFASSQTDTGHYIDAVKLFEQASGMRVNWDKTDGMYIGSNTERPPAPEVTRNHTDGTSTTISFAQKIYSNAPGALRDAHRLQYHTRLRYLGVIIGTSLPADHNWHVIKSNIEATINNRLIHDTTDVGKVINCNPCVIGS